MISHAELRSLLALVLLMPTAIASAQETRPSLKLKLGTTWSSVEATFGKPFQKWNLRAAEDSAQAGAAVGMWQVYHLRAPGDRMYVTMLHFGAAGEPSQTANSSHLDELMLMPNGHWSVLQILKDNPEVSVLCSAGCDQVRLISGSGSAALLLEPTESKPDTPVIYFAGDSATIQWRSVSSAQDAPESVYVLPASVFESHHRDIRREMIGWWTPSPAPAP